MTRQQIALAGLAILAAQVSINVGAALGKSLFPLTGPEGIALLRTGIAALLLLAWVRPWKSSITGQQALWLVLYGLVLGSMNLLIYWSIARIPIGIAVAIEISGPLAVVLLTSRSPGDVLWFALALTGLLLLVPWPGSTEALDPLGIACALGAAACWALYIVIGKRAAEVKSKIAVAVGMSVACLVTVPVGLANAKQALFSAPVLAMGAGVALLSSAVPYLLEMKALERLNSRLFGVITSSAPAIAALCGFAILDEKLTAMQWVAIFAMIGASIGSSLKADPASPRQTASRPLPNTL